MVEEARSHAVGDVRHEAGELSFRARIGEVDERVWFRVADGLPTSADAVLPTCLMPTMRSGGRLEIPVPISPRVLRNQREFQAVQCAWSLSWELGDPPLREVEVIAPAGSSEPPPLTGRVAAFFSSGVDSWSTLIDHPEITDLVFVHGIDMPIGAERYRRLAPEVEERNRRTAEELGLGFHVVSTNLRQLSDRLARWEAYFGCALDAVALFLGPRFDRMLLANGTDHVVSEPVGTSRFIDQQWSTEGLEIVEDGGRYTRVERVARAARHPLARKTLRVCWENPGGEYNCGRCRKCFLTMLTLEALGLRDRVETFPPELDLSGLDDVKIDQFVLLCAWQDILDEIRRAGRADLEQQVEPVIERGRAALGVAPTYRHRPQPGPPPLGAEARERAARRDGIPADEGERLALLERILASRSWRWTGALRRLRARLR